MKNLTPNLYKHRERKAFLSMELGVFIDDGDVVLVKFTSSLGVPLGWHHEVRRSTLTVSQTQLAAWHQTLRLKLFNNVAQKSFFFRVVMYAVRDDGSSLAEKAVKSIILSRKIMKKTFLISIINRSQRGLWCVAKCFLFS